MSESTTSADSTTRVTCEAVAAADFDIHLAHFYFGDCAPPPSTSASSIFPRSPRRQPVACADGLEVIDILGETGLLAAALDDLA